MDITTLDDYEQAVLRVIEPGYDVMILVVPSYAKVNEFAAATALAGLKKKGLIAFEGRGRSKSAFLTDTGKEAYAALPPKEA